MYVGGGDGYELVVDVIDGGGDGVVDGEEVVAEL